MSEWVPFTTLPSSSPNASASSAFHPVTSNATTSINNTGAVNTTYSNVNAMSTLLQQIAAASGTSTSTAPQLINQFDQSSSSTPQTSSVNLIEQFLSSNALTCAPTFPPLNPPQIQTTTEEACLSGENLQMLATLAALRVEKNQKQQILANLEAPLVGTSAQLTPLSLPTPQLPTRSTNASNVESLLLLLAASQPPPLLSPNASTSHSTLASKSTNITTVVPASQAPPLTVQCGKRGRPRRSLDSNSLTMSSVSFPKPIPKAELSKSQTLSRPSVSSGQRIPTSADSCSAIANFLMSFNKSSDVEFSRKAIESLIKKLKDRHSELDTLLQAVQTDGQEAGSCITIPRTLDGRLQVAGRKGFPHVVYSRVFRWPDLHKNEIKHSPICMAAFDMKCDSVCINPYHYVKVSATVGMDLSPMASVAQKRSIGTEDFRRLLIATPNSSPTSIPPDPSHTIVPSMNEDAFAPAIKLAKTQQPLNVEVEHSSTQFPFAATSPGELLRLLQFRQQQNEQKASPTNVQIPKPAVIMPQLALLQSALHKHEAEVKKRATLVSEPPVFIESRRSEHDSLRVLRERLQLDFNNSNSDPIHEFSLTDLCRRYPLTAATFMELLGELSTHSNGHLNEQNVKTAIDGHNESLELPRVLGAFSSSPRERAISSPFSSAGSPQISATETFQSIRELLTSIASNLEEKSHWKFAALKSLTDLVDLAEHTSVIQAMKLLLSEMYPSGLYDKYTTPDKPTFQPEPEQTSNTDCTCSFKYFEFGRQVGQAFHTKQSIVSVGQIEPDHQQKHLFDHFSVGANENANIELDVEQKRTLNYFRRQIGHGFFVECNRDGEIYLKSLTHGQLYIESNYLDREASVMPKDRLHRLYPNHVVKIFDLRQAFDQICFWVSHQSRAQKIGTLFMEEKAFISQMRSLCLVRCSFNAGWNSTRFPSFVNAPCTVEFYVNRALRLLDELLRSPRKARYYLRTGRLPVEKPIFDESDRVEEMPSVAESSAKFDPFVVLKAQKADLTKPGLELGQIKLHPSALEPPTKSFGSSIEQITQVSEASSI